MGWVSLKCRFLQKPHGVTSQKTPFFIVTAVKTSNLTLLVFVPFSYVLWVWEYTVLRNTAHILLASRMQHDNFSVSKISAWSGIASVSLPNLRSVSIFPVYFRGKILCLFLFLHWGTLCSLHDVLRTLNSVLSYVMVLGQKNYVFLDVLPCGSCKNRQ
jgi:hypothetical protein